MNYSWKNVSREFKNLICPASHVTACLNWFKRARGGGGYTSEAFNGHKVSPIIHQFNRFTFLSLLLSLYLHNNVASLRRRRAFSQKTTDTPHIFPTFPPPAFLWWMLAGESSSCNKKYFGFWFLGVISMCCVLGVLKSSFQAINQQQRSLGHQPQPSQVECEFKNVFRGRLENHNSENRNSQF